MGTTTNASAKRSAEPDQPTREPPQSNPAKAAPDAWGSIPERGSMFALEVLQFLYRTFGRRVCLVVLHGISFYFTLFAPSARKASRSYLETLWSTPRGRDALGRPPSFLAVRKHIHEFSRNIFDRFVAWAGDLDANNFGHRNSELLFEFSERGEGAILLGAHQGSFDMLRLLADSSGLTINVLMFTKHATVINDFFEKLDPKSRVRVLEIEPGSMKTAFAVRDCIARGEFVGILADRIHPGSRERPVFVDFLGRPTAFSLSPFVLASVIGCPVVHTQCIRLDNGSYEAAATIISDKIDPSLPRRAKAEALLRAFVAEIEETCYRTPWQWFNFFDYWGDREGGDG